MYIAVGFISGFNVGVEFIWKGELEESEDSYGFELNLGIFRIGVLFNFSG